MLILLVVAPCFGQGPQTQVEKEVKDFLDAYARAYEKKDVAAIMAMIAPDPWVVFVETAANGRYVGPEAIKKSYEAEFGQFKSAETKYTWVSVRSKGDVAWFVAEEMSVVDLGDEKLDLPARWSGVLEKRDGKWLLVQSHFSFSDLEPEEMKPR